MLSRFSFELCPSVSWPGLVNLPVFSVDKKPRNSNSMIDSMSG